MRVLLAALCRVVIRPTLAPPPHNAVINLAEVQLFAAQNGSQIDRRLLTMSLSSVYTSEDDFQYPAGFCNDGAVETKIFDEFGNRNPGPRQVCHTFVGDPSPRLTVLFPCTLGLSRVVVTNRVDCWECSDRINDFSLDVVSATGAVTHIYQFHGSAESYTFMAYTLPGPCKSGTANPCGTGSCMDTSATTYQCSCPPGSVPAINAAGSPTCEGGRRASAPWSLIILPALPSPPSLHSFSCACVRILRGSAQANLAEAQNTYMKPNKLLNALLSSYKRSAPGRHCGNQRGLRALPCQLHHVHLGQQLHRVCQALFPHQRLVR